MPLRASFLAAALFLSPALVFAHGDLHGQIADLTRRIAQTPAGLPRPAFLFLQRAELNRMHGDYPAAEADLNTAARLDPHGRDERMQDLDLARGRLYLDWGRAAEARAALERYLQRAGDHPEALIAFSRALAAMGLGEEAVKHLDRAIARHPQPEPDHYLARTDLLASLGRAHLRRAIDGLDEGLRRLGSIVTLETRAVDLEVRLRRWDAALARLDRLARQMPRRDPWLARRAEILELAGRPRQAKQARLAALAAIDGLPLSVQQQRPTAELRHRLQRQQMSQTPLQTRRDP